MAGHTASALLRGLAALAGHLPQVVEAKPWPSQAQTALGTRGCAFLRGLLRFPPAEHSLDLDHAWFHPERLVLGGRCAPPSGFLPEGVISKPGLTGASPEEALATPRGRKRKGGAISQAELKQFNKKTRPAGKAGPCKDQPRR